MSALAIVVAILFLLLLGSVIYAGSKNTQAADDDE